MQPVNSKSTLPFLLLCLFAAVITACKTKEQPAAVDSILRWKHLPPFHLYRYKPTAFPL